MHFVEVDLTAKFAQVLSTRFSDKHVDAIPQQHCEVTATYTQSYSEYKHSLLHSPGKTSRMHASWSISEQNCEQLFKSDHY